MTRKTKDTPGAKPLIILALIAVILFAGLIYYVKYGPTAELKPIDNAQPAAASDRVQVPVAVGGGPDAAFEMKTVDVPKGQDPVMFAVNHFLESLSFVQPEAKLLDVHYEGENVELVFSSNFRQTYGTDDEATIIKGILRAVQANSKAKTATFMEGGKPIETLGSTDLAGPQSIRDWTSG